jgi:hypothetical protein
MALETLETLARPQKMLDIGEAKWNLGGMGRAGRTRPAPARLVTALTSPEPGRYVSALLTPTRPAQPRFRGGPRRSRFLTGRHGYDVASGCQAKPDGGG